VTTEKLAVWSRFARAVGALALAAGVLAGPQLLLARAPTAFLLVGFFALPLVVAAFASVARWVYAAGHGRRRLPKPPARPGRLEAVSTPRFVRSRPRT
jgi:hypothetical protein